MAEMAPPSSALITPIEPARARPGSLSTSAARPTHAVYANASHRLEAAVATSCGSQHAVNEDAHSALAGTGRLFVVADGVGGGAMAQTASRMLVAQLHEALDGKPIDGERVALAMLGADRAIAAAIARVTERPGAATVALCAPLDAIAARWLVAWVGDCRVYRWSPRGGGRLALLTRDDTFAHLGEAPPPGGAPSDPARMVGNGATTGANAALHDLGDDELLALCSDGVHKHLDDADWCRVLAAPLALAQRGQALIALARARGSVDDATALLLHRSGPQRSAR
jgi:protein phosphatase